MEAGGLLPNRQLALWPYTDVRSPHLEWGNDHILVHATLRGGALKVGFPNPRGWLAYHLGEGLFVKKARFEAGEEYFDLGSSSECYCNDRFLELETLGPAGIVQPECSVHHREVWQVFDKVPFTPGERAVQALIEDYRHELPTVKDAVDHIDHIVKVIGIDHVGIGADDDGGGGLRDCSDVTHLPRITEELLRRGYREADLAKIWGGNALRVLEAARRVAR